MSQFYTQNYDLFMNHFSSMCACVCVEETVEKAVKLLLLAKGKPE